MITPDELRKCAMCVYLAAEETIADDISRHLKEAADTISRQTELLRKARERAFKERDEAHGMLMQAKARIQEIEELVREMGELLQRYIDYKESRVNFFYNSKAVLSKPEIKAIMEKKP